jgi:SSS family solute:Na+ symporter
MLMMVLPARERLIHLSAVDIFIIAVYFAMVLFIGFYVKGATRTSKEFFMAGREMTAWIAGVSFISANLGSLEMMGWAGSTYQYGILALHAYWVGAIPAMLFLGLVMMPFYYISKTYSVPGYLHLRFGNPTRAFSAVSFAFMTILMSGINMYSMALVMKVVLGPELQHLGFFPGGRYLCGRGRIAVGYIQRDSAIRPDLGGSAAHPHSRHD